MCKIKLVNFSDFGVKNNLKGEAMETWYNFKKGELVVEPESKFELDFLTDLFAENTSETTIMINEVNQVLAITIKSAKPGDSNSENKISAEEIDEMYEEMVNE